MFQVDWAELRGTVRWGAWGVGLEPCCCLRRILLRERGVDFWAPDMKKELCFLDAPKNKSEVPNIICTWPSKEYPCRHPSEAQGCPSIPQSKHPPVKASQSQHKSMVLHRLGVSGSCSAESWRLCTHASPSATR